MRPTNEKRRYSILSFISWAHKKTIPVKMLWYLVTPRWPFLLCTIVPKKTYSKSLWARGSPDRYLRGSQYVYIISQVGAVIRGNLLSGSAIHTRHPTKSRQALITSHLSLPPKFCNLSKSEKLWFLNRQLLAVYHADQNILPPKGYRYIGWCRWWVEQSFIRIYGCKYGGIRSVSIGRVIIRVVLKV